MGYAFLLLAIPVAMALPPLSKDELRSQADRVVVGIVESVKETEQTVPNGTDVVYAASVRVLRVDKERGPGKDDEGRGKIEVRYRKTGHRPRGWTGPAGQSTLPPVGPPIRLYLSRASRGWELLEPNGWEAVDDG